MPEPTHTLNGVPCGKLKVVKEISPDFDEDLFFAIPFKMTVGPKDKNNGFIFYVYDFKLVKIFMFNEKFKYIGQFLTQGQGPSEILPGSPGNIGLATAPDGTLFVSDPVANKLIHFSATGKYLKDIKLSNQLRSDRDFPPIYDEQGYLYMYSSNKGIVDKIDGKMNVVHTYLDYKLNGRYVIFKPRNNYKRFPEFEYIANQQNVSYDILTDGRLLIYLLRSSAMYIFEKDRLIRNFDILIDQVLTSYKKKAEAAAEEQKNLGAHIFRHEIMFGNFFVDKDAPYFYLMSHEANSTLTLYKFDLKGKLVKMVDNIKAQIFAKRHGLFFGISGAGGYQRPIVFKMEDNK